MCLALTVPARCAGYSVFTHEQIIDLAWRASIQPLLRARFPGITDAKLREAHAYAYGGCAIQDMGYYPFGREFFSDLTHYVRTGQFIEALLRDARTPDEYAFALGALSHYVGDTIGHKDAVNPATALQFPKLEHKYGPAVTYDESPHGHVRTEFAFDVDQLSHHRLAPAAYLRYIGLEVSRGLLERAFFETYGLRLREVLGEERPAVRSYRSAVRSFLPRIAYAESVIHKKNFPEDTPDATFQQYQATLANADFEHRWEKYRKGPSFRTYMLVILIRIVPKVGILSDLAIRGPSPEAEQMYVASINRTNAAYAGLLKRLGESADGALTLDDLDLDTGDEVKPGRYALTNKTYASLLKKLTAKPATTVPADLKRNLLAYYADANAPITTKKDADAWRRIQDELVVLRGMPTRS